jgi:hypothetical protein
MPNLREIQSQNASLRRRLAFVEVKLEILKRTIRKISILKFIMKKKRIRKARKR